MKVFTSEDLKGAKLNQIYTDFYTNGSGEHSEDLIRMPLDWQRLGLQQTTTGYGRKLTTEWKINYEGKLYRLYCTQISNAGSVWFIVKGKKIFVS